MKVRLKWYIIVLSVLVILCWYIKPHRRYKDNIHMIYIPWNKDGSLKPDYNDFNKKFYNRMCNHFSEANIYMWTYPELREFSNKHEPGLWDRLWSKVKHPTQIVDFYRWFVVYHLGGIYWQYESEYHMPLKMLKSKDNDVVLLTESIISKTFAEKIGREQIIRKGIPEEEIRVANQVFWSKPHSKFVKHVMDSILERLDKYTVNNDYDILYIGANAMISEVYDRYPNKKEIKLIPHSDRIKIVTFSSRGSWRQYK